MKAIQHLLLVDDDRPFCQVMSDWLIEYGFKVHAVHDLQQIDTALNTGTQYSHAIIDLNLAGESGLHACRMLLDEMPDLNVVILTGYASIATAVESIRMGALNYLTKPIDVEQVVLALNGHNTAPDSDLLPRHTLGQVEWDHIQSVLQQCGHNVSQAARILGMHRRTLQRKLQKKPKSGV